MSFHLRLCTPDKTFFDAQADSVVCPGLGGYFGVLSRHLPLVAGLDAGIVRVEAAGHASFFVIDTGLADVQGHSMDILANTVLPAPDAARAEEKLQELSTLRLQGRRLP